MSFRVPGRGPSWLTACAGVLALFVSPAYGQRQSADSNVGYIDGALPVSLARLRFDTSYNANRPSRAEFFYPRGQPQGRGLPSREVAVDYQEVSAYLEAAFGPRFSAFFEGPARFLNPDVNDNSAGFGDLNAGFKYAFWEGEDVVATFQLRTYVPTGDADRGLGTAHVSLEPAVLVFAKLDERLTLEGELRYWTPIGGSDFAGDVLRYGVGLSYGCRSVEDVWVTPVVEVVGWTALGGRQEWADTPASRVIRRAATGDTIVNVKLGVRAGLGDLADVYAGYGRALTGEVWYKDTWRVEFRLRF